ncbi:hypothetical protein Tco_1029210 [Tanacetum coccineum]|uniref:Uncharacterized protein n=1 Tax=Tanacetum coccineum TaxID=301880 RepID=A0ABQ5G2T5_9ASTR
MLSSCDGTHALVKKKGKAKDKYYGKLILDLGNEVRSSVEEGAAAMENLVRKLGSREISSGLEFKFMSCIQEIDSLWDLCSRIRSGMKLSMFPVDGL